MIEGGRCFNKRLLFQKVRIVLRYPPICLYMCMRHSAFKIFSRIKIENQSLPLFPPSVVQMIFLSLNNSRFGDNLHRIYPNQLQIMYGNNTQRYSYLDLHIEIDSGGRLKTNVYDKRNDFTFAIVNFPFIRNNILASSAYGLYAPQLIHYSRACAQNSAFSTKPSH